jgi:hypothetical protein
VTADVKVHVAHLFGPAASGITASAASSTSLADGSPHPASRVDKPASRSSNHYRTLRQVTDQQRRALRVVQRLLLRRQKRAAAFAKAVVDVRDDLQHQVAERTAGATATAAQRKAFLEAATFPVPNKQPWSATWLISRDNIMTHQLPSQPCTARCKPSTALGW